MCRKKWGDFCLKFWWILGIEISKSKHLILGTSNFWLFFIARGWVLGHRIHQKFLHNNTPEEFRVRFPILLFWKENGGERNL
jgi:hypothetical protein